MYFHFIRRSAIKIFILIGRCCESSVFMAIYFVFIFMNEIFMHIYVTFERRIGILLILAHLKMFVRDLAII